MRYKRLAGYVPEKERFFFLLLYAIS